MGEISDYYRLHELEDCLGLPISREPEYFTWWININGKRIKLSNMSDSHICNCIGMIDRSRTGWRSYWKEPLLKELESR